ncbi:hypothetical protein MKX03_025188 [Papaver bracteatum]|nr:hypothetical protein MKX03_025188 [Papaver bracteatum]
MNVGSGNFLPMLKRLDECISAAGELFWLYTQDDLCIFEFPLSIYIKSIVHQRNSDFAKKEELPSLTRSGCAYLVQVCLHEHPLIFSHLPPRTVKFASIDRSSVHLFRILADVHERLTFRAGTHIWDEIANYIPFDDDLNYPAKLECSAETEPVTTSVKC